MGDEAQRIDLPTLAGAAWLTAEPTRAVLAALAQAGHEARIVGGAVRNALFELPVTDIDIATPATPRQVSAAAAAAGLTAIPTGIDHGTVTVLAHHVPFEVTTLREDVETYRRHAKVAFTADWAADARRRDFTINALYCRPDGTIEDPLGGLADIAARRIRFIGNPADRIHEDDLRILRFFRFHAQYGEGPADADALAACERERAGLRRLSAERVRAELVKLLCARRGHEALAEMQVHGLLAPLLHTAPRPGLVGKLANLEQRLGAPCDAMLRLSMLSVAVEEDRAALAARLRLSNAERDRLLVVDPRTTRLVDAAPARQRAMLYKLGADHWRRLTLAAACLSPAHEAAWLALRDLPQRWAVPAFPLRGADVLALGVPPGPAIGEALAAVEAAWIEADFALDAQALHARLAAEVARAAQDPQPGSSR